MTSMQTRNTMDTGFLSAAYDRAVHLAQDLVTGYYLPATNKAQDVLTEIGSVATVVTASCALTAINAIPVAPALSMMLAYGAAVAGVITYSCFGERGRDARLHKPSP